MNNNVLVTVHGLQHETDDKEGIQTKQTGSYRLVAGKHVISYKEYFKDENTGKDAIISNLLKISDDTITLTKRGATNTEMTFKEGTTHTTFYETPFGSMQMRLDTTRVDINEQTDRIEISIDYGLDMNYSHISDCTITLIIESLGLEDYK